METVRANRSVDTVTGVFATKTDAENAYRTLLKMGYQPDEVTLIMSEETCRKLYEASCSDLGNEMSERQKHKLQVTRISEALDVFGSYVAIPGLALVVAGDLGGSAARAITSSVLSDDYAEYFQRRIQDGEILIDFGLHAARERKTIMGVWETYGGMPLSRKVSNAA